MEAQKARVLLIDGSTDDIRYNIIRKELHEVIDLSKIEAKNAVEHAVQNEYELIIIDSVQVQNIQLLVRRLCAQVEDAQIIVITTSPTWRRAREAFYAGAIDYLKFSDDPKEILAHLSRILMNIN